MRIATFALALLLCGACVSPTAPATPATAPTPYTAEQIRDANPTGTVRVYRIQQSGQPTVVQTMTFLRSDEAGARVESSMTTEGGEPFGLTTTTEAGWEELRNHAAFLMEITQRKRAECTVSAGRVECWLYTVAGEERGVPTLNRFWFALEMPGPPVLMEIEREETITFRMELLNVRHET